MTSWTRPVGRLMLALMLAVLVPAAPSAQAMPMAGQASRTAAATATPDSPCHDSAMSAPNGRQMAHPDAGKAAPPPTGHDCCDQGGMTACPIGHGCGCAGLASLTLPLPAVIALALPRTPARPEHADTPPPQHAPPPLRPPIG